MYWRQKPKVLKDDVRTDEYQSVVNVIKFALSLIVDREKEREREKKLSRVWHLA